MARDVWEWVLADPEARAWLDGQPDEFGMKVNPIYSTNPERNANGTAFGDPIPESFPKADPYCFQAPKLPSGITPSALCGTDWLPYAGSLRDAAQFARSGDDRAKVDVNPFPISPQDAWAKALPQAPGQHSFLAVTDTASATQYGIQAARLSRAGDDAHNRTFVAADDHGLLAGASRSCRATTPRSSCLIRPRPHPRVPVDDGGVRRDQAARTRHTARSDYAAFLDYAAGAGQTSGVLLGQLPRGYTPLPEELRAQTSAAAKTVVEMVPAQPSTTLPPAAPSSTGTP